MSSQQPPRPGQPGAMTMAMSAVQKVTGPKVLRIGMIQGGKVVEERIIRNRDTISVGTTEKNTFCIVGNNVPPFHELFPMSGDAYSLNFTESMEGRVAGTDGVKSLAQLRESGQAKRAGSSWQVPLTEQMRGQITVGDVKFLFQFVAPPAPQPKPQLPAALRSNWGSNIDWTYNACMSFFLVIAFGALAYVEYLYDPIVDDSLDLDVRTATLVTPPPDEAPVKPVAKPDTTTAQNNTPAPNTPAPTTPKPAAEQHTNTASANTPGRTEAQRAANRAEAQREAQSAADDAAAAIAAAEAAEAQAASAVITGLGTDGPALPAAALNRGMEMGDTANAMASVAGVGGAGGGDGVATRGGDATGGVGGGGRGDPFGRTGGNGPSSGQSSSSTAVSSQPTVVIRRGRAAIDAIEDEGGGGNLSPSEVRSKIGARLTAIRTCYERQLRINGDLHGTVRVKFRVCTVGGVGRVNSANGSGLAGVDSCVANVIRGITFSSPGEECSEFSNSFNFDPAN